MKLSRISTALLLAATSNAAFSASNIFPTGPNLGYGDASNINSLYAFTNNPARIGANLHLDNNYGVGITASGGLRQTYLNELADDMNDNIKPILEEMDESDEKALELAEELQTNINSLLLDSRDNFQLNTNLATSIPILIAHNAFGGLALELSALNQTQSRMLSSNKPITLDAGYLISNPDANQEDIIANGLIIQSAIYNKVATYQEAALSYANQFFVNEYGALSIGGKAKFMQARLKKSVRDIGKYLTNLEDEGIGDQIIEDFSDLAEGDFENTLGFDLGLMWTAPNWYLGATVMNVNSPTFNYNVLGTVDPDNPDQQYVDNFYKGYITLTEEVVLSPQGRVEAALYSESRRWTLAGSIDTNETTDLINNAYQWATVSAAFATSANDAWWWALIPDLRAGYRANLVGVEQAYVTGGMTFGPLNIDLAVSPDVFSGTNGDIPEAFAASAGLEIFF